MRLIEKNLRLDSIMIDPNNPRFPSGHDNRSQNDIIEIALDDKSSKELLNSLNTCVRWVNKIVIMKTADYNKKHKDLEDYEYIAVEGNTRLACLKSGRVEGYDQNSEIPVLIAVKENNELENTFQDSILITQGIANVMVVKQWDQIAKAKHIYNLYLSKINLGEKLHNIITQISRELGMKKVECKKHIQRYSIFKKVDEEDRTLTSSEWGFLEAFDVNPNTRSFTGLSEDLIWDDQKSEELIPLIGDLINTATREGVNTKDFRNYIKKIIENTAERDDVINKITSFTEDDNEDTLVNAINDTNPDVTETEWSVKIKSADKSISEFPANSDWAGNFKPQLETLSRKVDKIIKMIDVE